MESVPHPTHAGSGVGADVSICIPAWMAEPFIEDTIRCATAQTHSRITILISIDKSTDATGALCRKHAAGDDRIRVFEQEDRLGWAENVNFLLDQVRTPYFFLYFHDDVIVPRYTQTLLRELDKRPDAVSIHCDMAHFGGSEHVSVGRAYEGSAAQRLMTFLLAHERGSPLRSLTRSSALDKLRLPTDATDGLWANEPYLMKLLAAGPALHLPERLYLRWDQRTGGLTDGWKKFAPGVAFAGHKANIASALGILEAAASTDEEREALVFSLYLNMIPRLRHLERESGTSLFLDPSELHPAFSCIRPPADMGKFGACLAEWAMDRNRSISQFDGNE